MAPRRRACQVCGSRRWHKEPTSGAITCSEGHVLQNYVNEAKEIDEMPAYAVRKRNIKSGRKKKEKQSKADPGVYHGERARYHYLQCLQLILRMQVVALRTLWELPPEFEAVCRDVWTMHLSLLPNPPSAEPLEYLQDNSRASETVAASSTAVGSKASEEPTNSTDDEKTAKESEQGSSSSSDTESDEDDQLSQIMPENSDLSSSDGSPDSGQERTPKPARAKKRHLHSPYDSLAGNLSVLIVSCWTLRLPVIYMDFIRLVESYDLPYLDTPRLLPATLHRHLSKHTIQALSPHFAPTAVRLHTLTSRLAKLMNKNYSIYTPDLNAAPVLWRAVRSLSGTPTLYVLTKRIARVLAVPLSLHRSLASALTRTKKQDPGWHKHDDAIPEVSLVALVVVVLKMVYGLDGKPRYPRDKDDPACALPQISEYLARINRFDQESERKEPFSSSSQQSALDLDDEQIDAYMSFCEKALLPREGHRPEERSVIMDFYPLRKEMGASHSSIAMGTEDVEASAMSATPLQPDEAGLLPGQEYSIYNTLDIFGVLPHDYGIVMRRATHWAGVDEDYLSGIVERFERRLLRWWNSVGKKDDIEQNASDSD